VRLIGWVIPVAITVLGRDNWLPRLLDLLMLSRNSRFVGRWPSYCESFSSSSKSDDEFELDVLVLLRLGRDRLPSSNSTWVSDEDTFCICGSGPAAVGSDCRDMVWYDEVDDVWLP
jgi:hypothetical protein